MAKPKRVAKKPTPKKKTTLEKLGKRVTAALTDVLQATAIAELNDSPEAAEVKRDIATESDKPADSYAFIRAARAAGKDFDLITNELNKAGLMTKTHRPWTVGNVRSVCCDKRRPDYLGDDAPEGVPRQRRRRMTTTTTTAAAPKEEKAPVEKVPVTERCRIIIAGRDDHHAAGIVKRIQDGIVTYLCDFNKGFHDAREADCVVVSLA